MTAAQLLPNPPRHDQARPHAKPGCTLTGTHTRTHTRQRGFTLVEVLVAILLFSFGLLALVALQARAVQYSADAEDRNRAALLANEVIAMMWGQNSTSSLSTASINAWVNRVKGSAQGLPNGSATVSAPDSTGAVTITITWKAPYKTSAQGSNQYVSVVTVAP